MGAGASSPRVARVNSDEDLEVGPAVGVRLVGFEVGVAGREGVGAVDVEGVVGGVVAKKIVGGGVVVVVEIVDGGWWC